MANKTLPKSKKRQGVYLRLPPDIIKWLRKQKDKSQADLVIEALRNNFNIKEKSK